MRQNPLASQNVKETCLLSELTGVGYNDAGDLARLHFQLMQNAQHENRSFPHARLCLTNDILALKRDGDALLLNCTHETRLSTKARRLRAT